MVSVPLRGFFVFNADKAFYKNIENDMFPSPYEDSLFLINSRRRTSTAWEVEVSVPLRGFFVFNESGKNTVQKNH